MVDKGVCTKGDTLNTGHGCDTTSSLDTPGQDKVYVEDKLVWEYNGTIGIAQDVFFMMPIHTEGKHVIIYARDNLGNEFTYDNIN